MRAKKVKKLEPEMSFAEAAARIIRVRLDELRGFAPDALEAERSDDQHDMRIAAKRLRYVLESTESCFGSVGPPARRRAKELQEILGALHDCDVMLPRVERHLAELRRRDADSVRESAGGAEDLDPALAAHAPNRTAYRGLEILAVHLEARRALAFERFVEFWRKQEREGTWDALDRAAREVVRAAKGRSEAGTDPVLA